MNNFNSFCLAIWLSIPTLIIILNHWNKSYILVWFFNMFIFYILIYSIFKLLNDD
jgi:hypothetical protein